LHFGHIRDSFALHLPQNLDPSLFSNWHFGHFIFEDLRSPQKELLIN
jgi:hypothetical protein